MVGRERQHRVVRARQAGRIPEEQALLARGGLRPGQEQRIGRRLRLGRRHARLVLAAEAAARGGEGVLRVGDPALEILTEVERGRRRLGRARRMGFKARSKCATITAPAGNATGE